VRIPAGGTVRVKLQAPGRAFADRLQLELSEPPRDRHQERVADARRSRDCVRHRLKKVKPGLQGNLIVNAFAPERKPLEKQRPGQPAPRLPRHAAGHSFEIVAANNPNGLRPSAQGWRASACLG